MLARALTRRSGRHAGPSHPLALAAPVSQDGDITDEYTSSIPTGQRRRKRRRLSWSPSPPFANQRPHHGTTRVDWSILEQKVIWRILTYMCLTPHGSKTVRLVNQAARDLATPFLFSRVHVSPSMNSIRRLSNIGKHATLAGCVEILECHNWGLAEYYTDDNLFRDSLERHFASISTVSGPDELSQLEYQRLWSRLYSSYVDEIAAQRDLQRAGVSTTLSTTILLFPRLRDIIWHECQGRRGEIELSEQSPLFHRTGVKALGMESCLRFLDTCLGIQSVQPATFTATRLNWLELESNQDRLWALGSILRSVENLRLQFVTGYLLDAKLDGDMLNHMAYTLGQARFVQELRLGFHDRPSFDTTSPLGQAWSCFLRGIHPHLRRLTLDNSRATEDELVGFVKAHRDTLVSLTLHGVELKSMDVPPYPRYTERPSSAVRCLWRLGQVGLLEEVSLHDVFSDSWSQGWVISRGGGPGCFRRRVEEYICRRGPFPFSGLEWVPEECMMQALSNNRRERETVGVAVQEWHEELKRVYDATWSFEERLLC